MGVAFVDIKYMLRLIVAFRHGVVVRFREEYEDEDIDTEFKMIDGDVYVSTSDGGWEQEPISDPFSFFEEIFHEAMFDKIYFITKDGTEFEMWDAKNEWKSMNILAPQPLQSSLLPQVKPLKTLAALAILDHMGTTPLIEYENQMDYETRIEVFKPITWWISS